ncbi:MAG: class I SAM-dependent methyltransferase, partial [Gammaproteobacteria bacterium]|nr:class I SAM-dependent methyltransferase [Gammaproteobacteria bacterium]
MLVAGCGTGMDAIDLAMHVRDATVTAIDLSRASLAYG